MSQWQEYFEKTKDRPPRLLLVKALKYVARKGTAIDLGAGALTDSKFLLKQGFEKVIALDKEAVAQEVAATFPKDRFEYVIQPLEEYPFPTKTYDLVNAQFSLPFVNPQHFKRVFGSILDSLSEGGVFVGQLFGDRDEWCSDKSKTFQSLAEAQALFARKKLVHFEEEEKDGSLAVGGMKHWHIYHFIALNGL